MKEWLKKTARWIFNTFEEADSIDPWRSEHAVNPEGIRLFDVTAIHLQDHGYFPRLYRSGNMMVVYRTRWARILDRRVGALAFEIGKGWPSSVYNKSTDEQIWSFGFGKPWSVHAGTSVKPRERPKIICDVSDPFALDRILEATNEFYISTNP